MRHYCRYYEHHYYRELNGIEWNDADDDEIPVLKEKSVCDDRLHRRRRRED